MKKIQKQEILEFVSSLQEAHDEVHINLIDKKYIEALNLLCDCQECAIELGNILESIEGEGIITISYIEKYSELVFRYYEKLKKEQDYNEKFIKKLIDSLNRHLSNMKNSIKNDIRETKEVVFFPYKASMWDSLESVYLAAKKEEEYDVFCVPIPYYDKNPDGSLGKMHYEGAEYPRDIEIINWREYNIEERRPDIVFIHNPYDDCNIVTSIHPNFYSSKIRKYTDKLIYIPYFVHQNNNVPNYYCVLPGTLYSHKVILQSEKVREQYMQYYLNKLKSWGEKVNKEQIEYKFLSLGSPKYDILQNERDTIPNEWKSFLEDDRKLVVFFNTNLKSIMGKDIDQFFKKVRTVFKYFKNSDKAVLLWRPHPLMIQTAKSMNPRVLSILEELIEYYKIENIGIYDDSPNLHRAINLSDIYYGDTSSVVELFKVENKPVMIMNHKIIEDEWM